MMDFTGSRKYSVPRLASAKGEESARRAMPTRSGCPGGGRDGPLSRGSGTLGNKEGVGSIRGRREAFRGCEKSAGAIGIEVAVAITRLAKHGCSISPFVRFVKQKVSPYVRLLRIEADGRPPGVA